MPPAQLQLDAAVKDRAFICSQDPEPRLPAIGRPHGYQGLLSPSRHDIAGIFEMEPRWSPQNRPVVVTSKPANGNEPGQAIVLP